ncbi:MAG: MATE family efflux transporter [Bacteroidota bacterium]
MNKEILRLAIPNIISNISVPLLSTVDTALMGRLSEAHIGAVGLGAMIFNFIYWNFGFLRMGTTGITAQAFGKERKDQIMLTLGRALVVAVLIAGSILLLQYPIGQLAFQLMNVPESQQDLIADYFYIRVWAAPASLGLYAFMGWFFGMQNAVFPLVITLVINTLNIALNFLFVLHFGMEADGVAMSTLIVQYVGLILAVILFWWKYKSYIVHLKRRALLVRDELKRFLVINRDIFIRTACLTFAFSFFYSQSADSGTLILAANVILMQFVNWMSYGVDGFAYAAESLVGKYAGKSDRTATQRAVRLSFFWGMGLAGLYALIYGVFGHSILALFTNQTDVITATLPFLSWMLVFPIAGTPCYIWDGIYIGLTASKQMRNAMLLSLGVYMIVHFLLKPTLGNHGLWAALMIFMVARAAFQWWFYDRQEGFWKLQEN